MTWLLFALLTVASWGIYGILLHKGATGMEDPIHGRYKAFLWVGIAYFVTAVVAPVLMLSSSGASWNMSFKGVSYSFIAGVVGAIGAFGVLLAFGVKGSSPAVVMSIIFAGAPVVNALVATWLHPPERGWGSISPVFWIGIGMAALGGFLVTKFKPPPPGGKKPPAETAAAAPTPASAAEVLGLGENKSTPSADSVARLDLTRYEVGRRD